MQTNPVLVGFASSVVTELLKFFPVLRGDTQKSVIAIIVLLIGTFFFTEGGLTLANFGQNLVSAFASYKMIVQPLASATKMPTQ